MTDSIPADMVENDIAGASATPVPRQASIPVDMVENDLNGELSASYGIGDPLGDLGSHLITGVKNAPAAFIQTIKDIPTGISNLAHLPEDLFSAGRDAASLGMNEVFGTPLVSHGTNYDRALRTLKGGGSLVSTAVAAPLGPVGMAGGQTLFDKLLQVTGSEPLTSATEDAQNFAENLGTIGALGLAGKAVGSTVKGTVKAMPKVANALDRYSIGMQQKDYGGEGATKTVALEDGTRITKPEAQINKVLEEGKLGKSRDPGKVAAEYEAQTAALAKQAGEIIDNFDIANALASEAGKGVTVYPTFTNTEALLKSGRFVGNDLEIAQAQLNAIRDNIDLNGQGKLRYLQEQKKTYGEKWKEGDKLDPTLKRAIYIDLKNSIERYTPEVKPINAELSNFKVAEDAINRRLRAKAATSPMTETVKKTFTTGGMMAPIIAGGVTGGPVGAILGTGAAATIRALATRQGQANLARSLRSVSKYAAPLSDLFTPLAKDIGATTATVPTEAKTESRKYRADQYSSLFTPQKKETMPIKAQPIAATVPDAIIKATMVQESRGKSDAVSPKGATGLMQIMPATAKEIAKDLGVTNYDLKDPNTSMIFGRHYLTKLLNKFDGNIELALAAYNAGPGNVTKWIARWGPDWATISGNLKKNNSFTETVNYVPSVLKRAGDIVDV